MNVQSRIEGTMARRLDLARQQATSFFKNASCVISENQATLTSSIGKVERFQLDSMSVMRIVDGQAVHVDVQILKVSKNEIRFTFCGPVQTGTFIFEDYIQDGSYLLTQSKATGGHPVLHLERMAA